ncbi:topoisomerase I binding, arginine/serine-rich a [Thalassophryne amazonica]|uniref:topoisomerase I binding, arginine/serine-rich a n=1 Tax=Thalassophryne amazonica TaxID=390379 RepID=UPI001470C5B3|nr:topoisomerase I binding, arginine/serine-rich a [Thalassophryne amazonica]
MSAIKFVPQQTQKSLRRNTSEKMSTELSPDSKCPICLDKFNNIAYSDTCLHKFCFRCIREWSKNKAECPLCKQPFNSIYHTINSEHDFQTYDLRPVDNGSFGTFGGVRFRYRTTLTGVHRALQRRTSPLQDNGVMFEASVNSHQQAQYRYIKQMMMRLAARRRAAREGTALHKVREQEMINFRRELYRKGLKVTNILDGGRSRDTSAEFYRRNPACLHRLIPWLKRELVVLYGAHGSLVNIVQHIIMSRITQCDMEDASFRDELRPFLQGRTDHFLHEFISFAKCPFNVDAYDQNTVYNCPGSFTNEDGSTNSSVITISEDEPNSLDLEPHEDTRSNLSSSVWDDETPGPSYFTAAEQNRENLTVPDSDSDTSFEEDTAESVPLSQLSSTRNHTEATHSKVNSDYCSDSDDCVIVSFLKPRAERTPELVQLSSDSDESSAEDSTEVPPAPQHIRFISPSPQPSQSSDTADGSRSQNAVLVDNQLNADERWSSTSKKHKTSHKSDRKNRDGQGTEGRYDHNNHRERHWSKNRENRRWRRSRSTEHRSPVTSPGNGSHFLIDGGCSYSITRDASYSKCSSSYNKRRDDDFSHSGYEYHRLSHSCSVQSYSFHSRDGDCDDGKTHHRNWRSLGRNYHKYSNRHFYSHSRSRSRESRRRARKRSRSRTYSSSRSPSPRSHHNKPGGKRKYKARHLEDLIYSRHSASYSDCDSSTLVRKHKKKGKSKDHKRYKERSKRCSKSLTMEDFSDESFSERSKRRHKKKKHKKKSKRHKSNDGTERRSNTVITIDSDSDYFRDVASSSHKEEPEDGTRFSS